MNFLQYVLGPKLYMEYSHNQMKKYHPAFLEKFSDGVMLTLNTIYNIGFYTSPLLMTILYRRGFFVMESITGVIKIGTGFGILVILTMLMRGVSRSQSESYERLIQAIKMADSPSPIKQIGERNLKLFDYEFSHWKVDFNVQKTISNHENLMNVKKWKQFKLNSLPLDIIAYISMHTFGICMMYPGSIRLLQKYMEPTLIIGRAKLLMSPNTRRYKIRTADGNDIDSVFVDNRWNGINGTYLVICSEGNAGFYEIGTMATPMALGYSVLGWNHPGFGGSTGQPFPDQDKNAIEAVVRFSINYLGFVVENIIMYGWSIGAFSSLWAATIFPNIKALILDATFDDVLYLAQSRMPEFMSRIVCIAIRNYCNLDNVELAKKYNGPIMLIRRTEDEVIAKSDSLESNRGNYLLLSILKYRYPYIFQTRQFENCQYILMKTLSNISYETDEDDICLSRLITYVTSHGKKFPMTIGEDYNHNVRRQMAEFLLRKHMHDFKATHCIPLPPNYFNIPWHLP